MVERVVDGVVDGVVDVAGQVGVTETVLVLVVPGTYVET